MYEVAFLRASKMYDFLVEKIQKIDDMKLDVVNFSYDELSEFNVYKYDLVIISLNESVLKDVEIFLNNIQLFFDGVIMVIDEEFSFQRKFIFNQLGVENYFYLPICVDDFVFYLPWYLNKKNEDNVMSYKGICLNLDDRTLRRGETVLGLKNMEFRLLKYLLVNKGKVLSKDRIMEDVWDMNSIVNSKTVEVHICRLRKKMEIEEEEKLLHTIPNTGYMLK